MSRSPLLAVVVLAVACAPTDDAPVSARTPEGPVVTEPAPSEPAPPAASAPPVTSPPRNGSAGCRVASAAPAGVEATRTLTVAGKARTTVRAVPAGHDGSRAVPLVFVFHSGGRTGASTRDYFGFGAFAESEAVFLYPDGRGGEWDLESPAASNEDVAFFDALVEDSLATLCVDRSRIFATGSSMGAYFTNQLGCRRGDVLRAIAPHAGSGPYDVASAYDDDGHLKCPTRPVAAMIFHGDKDRSVKLEEGMSSRDHWAWANGCKGAPSSTTPSPCVAYAGCARPVLWCQIPGGTHRIWDAGPKASWDFFRAFESASP